MQPELKNKVWSLLQAALFTGIVIPLFAISLVGYLLYYIHVNSVNETRQSKATTPEDNSFFSREKLSCLRQDLNPQRSAYKADALHVYMYTLPWPCCMHELLTKLISVF